MAKIGFIGLGPIGLPMAKKLAENGHTVKAYDSSKKAVEAAKEEGIQTVSSIAKAATGVEVVISLLPDPEKSKAAFLGEDGIISNADKGTLLIDCSNVYGPISHDIHEAAEKAEMDLLDAPAAGGALEAEKAKLEFMVRGNEKAFLEGEPLLALLSEKIYHDGPWSREFKEKSSGEKSRVVYKKAPKWKGAAVILIFLFLGGNAVFFALIEESIQLRGDQLTINLELGSVERTIFCRGTNLIGLDIEGC